MIWLVSIKEEQKREKRRIPMNVCSVGEDIARR